MLIDSLQFIGDVAQVAGANMNSNAYDIAGSTLQQPTDGAVLMRFVVTRPFTIPASFVGSQANSTVATTGSTVYEIERNGAQIGQVTFGAAATDGSFADATEIGAHAFVADDILTIVAPATADATHDDIGWTLSGILT